MNTVTHFYSLLSPWAYLSWRDAVRITTQHGARLNHKLVTLPEVFEANGGEPASRKSEAKQRYREMELQRWAEFRGVSLRVKPTNHPFDDGLASRLVIAAEQDGDNGHRLAYAMMRKLWHDDADLSDQDMLRRVVSSEGFDTTALFDAAEQPQVRDKLAENTTLAIERGVFGVPTYAVGDQIYWGQDRLDFVERHVRIVTPAAVGD
ncbi:MAG TPA: 2-hydroxychromene-2-carboxylate isomerase [Gammaproteobacteria bacterium]|nr:2-hydroxychromene-2-carboxylate isomerase [Gammaproteobacteria bacterium]